MIWHEYDKLKNFSLQILAGMSENKIHDYFKRPRNDYHLTRKWMKKHKPTSGPSVHFHKFTAGSVVGINKGLLDVNGSKEIQAKVRRDAIRV
jgi:hypothetical protein